MAGPLQSISLIEFKVKHFSGVQVALSVNDEVLPAEREMEREEVVLSPPFIKTMERQEWLNSEERAATWETQAERGAGTD
jgi:hypothetical protein